MKTLYICAYDGVYTCSLSADGALSVTDRLPLDRPMYACLDGGRLFVLLCAPDTPDSEDGSSAVVPLWLDTQRLPIDPCPALVTDGRVGCHLSLVGDTVYAANYSSASISAMPLDGTPTTLVTWTGHGTDPVRQEMPHPHFIAPIPHTPYLAVCDLGRDLVIVCDEALNVISECAFPAGCGPRHLCFSEDGRYAYCANELSSEVSVLRWDDSTHAYTHLCRYPTRAPGHGDHLNISAAIRLCETTLYVSNRGDDDVAVFSVADGGAALCPIAHLPCGGHWPRDIFVTDDLLLCACEEADSVTVLRMNAERTSAKQVSALTLPRPIAVLVV